MTHGVMGRGIARESGVCRTVADRLVATLDARPFAPTAWLLACVAAQGLIPGQEAGPLARQRGPRDSGIPNWENEGGAVLGSIPPGRDGPGRTSRPNVERDVSDPADRDGTADGVEARALRLLVVDDHEIVRQGLVALLERRRQFQVVAQAGTMAEALDQVRKFVPDLVLMDIRLPDGSGIEACRQIRAEFPTIPVVFLTTSPEDEDVFSAIIAGASGYVLKQSRAAELVQVLVAAGRGDSLLDPRVTGRVLERVRRIAAGTYTDATVQLTDQERKILPLLAEGMSNRQIAEAVFLSDKTVKNYVSSILSKLNLERRAQVASFVANHGSKRTDGAGRGW